MTSSITTDKVSSDKKNSLTINLEKKKITKEFSDNETLYFNVAATLTLQTPKVNDEEFTETYKFLYSPLTVPSQVFRQTPIEVQVAQVSSLKL